MNTEGAVDLPMVCVCTDEGLSEANGTMQLALTSLNCTPEDFLSTVTIGLNDDYNLMISAIWVDQWFGVVVSNQEQSFYVECDRAEDGLAAIWCHLHGV